MKQLSLFEDCTPKKVSLKKGAVEWKLFVDGASRKNPGMAGAGICLLKQDVLVLKKGFYLGIRTNNQAEYLALLLGIFYAKQQLNPSDVVYIFSDSELVVKHVKGEYKLRNKDLKQLFDLIFHLLENINYSFCHILREYNKEADAMANYGIDKKIKIPNNFKTLLQAHDISW